MACGHWEDIDAYWSLRPLKPFPLEHLEDFEVHGHRSHSQLGIEFLSIPIEVFGCWNHPLLGTVRLLMSVEVYGCWSHPLLRSIEWLLAPIDFYGCWSHPLLWGFERCLLPVEVMAVMIGALKCSWCLFEFMPLEVVPWGTCGAIDCYWLLIF